MSYLLHIDSTSFDVESLSRQVARTFLDNWKGPVVHRDLAVTPVPHISAAGISGRLIDRAQHTAEQAAAIAIQDELIDEFLGAGGYLFTTPIYNYGVPSSFKAWLDQIAVTGRTIKVAGGLPAAGRKAIVVSSRGGAYMPGSPHYGKDHLVPHLETILGFELGLELEFITPSFGLAPVVPEYSFLVPQHEASLAEAHEQARRLAQTFSLLDGPTSSSGRETVHGHA